MSIRPTPTACCWRPIAAACWRATTAARAFCRRTAASRRARSWPTCRTTQHPATIYVGVVNDKEWGGVFVSHNGGLTWSQISAGLNGSDVFSLGQASDGTIIAGTAHGIYRLQGQLWSRVNDVSSRVAHAEQSQPAAPTARSRARHAGQAGVAAAGRVHADPFDGGVNAIARTGDTLYAATSDGLLQSVTAGAELEADAWPARGRAGALLPRRESMVAVATLAISVDADDRTAASNGQSVSLPPTVTQLAAVAVDGVGRTLGWRPRRRLLSRRIRARPGIR